MRRALIFGFTLLAAQACTKPKPATPFVLRVGVVLPLGTLTPYTGGGAAAFATDLVFETLFRPAGSGITSRFVEDPPADTRDRWRLRLRPAVTFSDGSKVQPEDLAQSLRMRGFVASVADGYLSIFSPPDTGGLAGLLYAPIFKDTAQGPIGTGPFVVVEQGPERVRLKRLEPRPGRIDEVVLVGYPTARQAFVHLLRGQVDAMFPLDRHQAELLGGVPTLNVVRSAGLHSIVVQLMPRRLSRSERLGLARALPLSEIAEATLTCTAPPVTLAPVPPGRPLKVGYLAALQDHLARPALALRRALGSRGGDIVSVPLEDERAPPTDIDIMISTRLTLPPVMLQMVLRSDGLWNYYGYANPRYDAAVEAGDDAAAQEALRADPSLIPVCLRQRLGAIDARVRAPSLGEWGVFQFLPDWEVVQ